DQRERSVGDLDSLAVRDPAQDAHELRQAGAREDERLAARPDGREHLPEVGRAEDEHEVRWRLLDQLEQCVEGCIGELVRLVEDVDLVPPLDRLQDGVVADVADVVDSALRRGVHLDHVERGAVPDRLADVAGGVGLRRRPLLAVERLGEDPRERRLAGAPRAREQIRLADLAGVDRVLERPHDRLLPDDLVEALRAVLPVERGHRADATARAGCAKTVATIGAPAALRVSEPRQVRKEAALRIPLRCRGFLAPMIAVVSDADTDRRRWTLIAVCVTTFMLLLDITIVNVALPQIQRHLDAGLTGLQWVV